LSVSKFRTSNLINDASIYLELFEDLDKINDVGRRVRLECRCVSRDGTLLFGPKALRLEPTLARPPPPLPRPAVTVSGAAHGGGYRFRVVTYNLLADLYATQHAYPDCDPWTLQWGYRAPNLLRELTDAAADVLCLQKKSLKL
jgi:CCR4-NOT transcription complex subunit 6